MPDGPHRIKGSARERAQARERLRAELLAAAKAIAAESGGFEKVTVRSVADRVGYTAPIVYEYFANKDALLFGLVELGFTELAERLAKTNRTDRAPDVLISAATTYWDFAWADPQLYRLMHTLPGVSFGTADTPPAAVRCFVALKTIMDVTVPGHPASRYDENATTDLFWSQLHGLVSLALDNRIKGGARRGHDLLLELTHAFIANAGGTVTEPAAS